MLLLAFFQAFTPSTSVVSGKDLQHIERFQTKRLAPFSPPLAVIGWTGAFDDGV